MTTTTPSATPIYDAVVTATGIDPSVKVAVPRPTPITKRQRHRFAPLTEAALVAAGFTPKESK
jgi:hypothetical protein